MPIRLRRLMIRSPEEVRSRAITRLERVLARTGEARSLALLMLVCTGIAGLFASWAMLRLGIDRMYVRYPLAVAVAYGVFLSLLWLWVLRRRRATRGDDLTGDLLDAPRIRTSGGTGGGSGKDGPDSFGGGRTGGGGAGGQWEGPRPGIVPQIPVAAEALTPAPMAAESPALPEAAAEAAGGGASGSGGRALAIPDLDDAGVIVAALAIAAAILVSVCASLYVVYIAPHLLAEVLFDGALVAGLYRRITRLPQDGWLATAVRHTWVPALITIVVFFAAGLAAYQYVPEARSIGDIWRRLLAP